MQSSRNTKIQNSICVILVLLTGEFVWYGIISRGESVTLLFVCCLCWNYQSGDVRYREDCFTRNKKVPYQCGSFSWISYFYPDSKICIYCGGDCDKQNALVFVLFPADF